jgi:glycosyltransferase involved in cell wall biosynthesis
MKRIGFISTQGFVRWAGSEELWSQTAKRMSELSYKVGVNVFSWKNEPHQITELSRTQNCEVYRRPIRPPLWQFAINKLLNKQQSTWIDSYTYNWLKQFQPDFIVISTGMSTEGREWMQACGRLNIPYVVIVHLANEVLWPHSHTLTNLSDLYKKAKAIFFVSKSNLETTSKLLGMHLENAKIAYNPFNVNPEHYIPFPKDNSIFRLACVARIGIEHKGQDILLEIMRQSKWKNRPITITLFGNGHHQETLEKLSKFWELDNIIFGGFAKDIEALWSTHHALVLPSRYEGLPLAVVEAMLCQRTCIVTDVGGNSELIEDDISGFIAPAATVPIFEQTLDRAWERRDEWKQIGEKASLRVREVIPADPVGNFVEQLRLLM